MFITAYDKSLKREVYFENKQGETNEGYVISEIDFITTPGVAYVSVDPTYVRDKSEKPIKQEGENGADYFWLNGGVK